MWGVEHAAGALGVTWGVEKAAGTFGVMWGVELYAACRSWSSLSESRAEALGPGIELLESSVLSGETGRERRLF